MTAALSVASPAMAKASPEPVRIGIMDLKADTLTYKAANVSIEYKAFTPDGAKEAQLAERSGDDHGAVVASAFVRHYRGLDPKTPIEVYAGNPFAIVKRPDGKSVMKLDFERGAKVLEWMHGKGVRIVVTAFNSPDAAGAARFMDKAESLGMVVFAAYSNSTGQGRVFPAGDARSVSVVDSSLGMLGSAVIRGGGRQFDGATVGVNFAMKGGVPQEAYGPATMTGSSFASPKAAAYAVYALRREPDLSRDQIVERMHVASRPMATSRDGETRTIAYLGDAVTDERFLASFDRRTTTPTELAAAPVEMLHVMMAKDRSR